MCWRQLFFGYRRAGGKASVLGRQQFSRERRSGLAIEIGGEKGVWVREAWTGKREKGVQGERNAGWGADWGWVVVFFRVPAP
jgi:hypothetical protein